MAAPGTPITLRRLVLPGGFVLVLFALLYLRQPSGDELSAPAGALGGVLEGRAFGTTFAIRWRGSTGADAVEGAVTGVIEAVNASMSTYHPQSELSRINRGPAETATISKALAAVLEAAGSAHERTGGAFDPTVGPLVDAWGFGPEEVVEPPGEDVLARARALVGFEAVVFDAQKRTFTKPSAGISVDLSAIAKGYAVDEVSRALEALGVTDHLVEIGGEVRVSGRGPRGPWTVGIERPAPGSNKVVQEVLALPPGRGLATSGNYRNFVLGGDGRKVTHIIDPRSGEPVTHGLGSVTVIAERCMTADALATALYVLGEADGHAWAEEQGVAALFLTLDGDTLRRRATSAYAGL